MLLSLFVPAAFFFLTTLSQAAGVLNTFIIDQTSPSVHFSDGWTVGTSSGSVRGSFESTTQVGASVTIELPTGAESVYYFGFPSSNGALYAAYLDYGNPGGRAQIVAASEHGGDVSQAASSLFAFTGLDPSKPHVLTVINLPDSEANNESMLTFDSLIVSVANGTDGLTFPPPLPNGSQSSVDSPVEPDSPPDHSNPPLVVGPGPAPAANASPDIPSSSRPVTSPTATKIAVTGTPSLTPSNSPSLIPLSPHVVPLGVGPQPGFQLQAPTTDSTRHPGPTTSIPAGVQSAPASSSIPSQITGSGNGRAAPSPTASVNVAGSPGVTFRGSSGSGASPTSDTVGSTPTSGAGSLSSSVPGGSSNAPDGSSNAPISPSSSPSDSGSTSRSGFGSPTVTAPATDSTSQSGSPGTASSSANLTPSGSTTPASSADHASSKSKLSGPIISAIAILSVLGVLSLILGGIVLFATRRKRLAEAQRSPSLEAGEAGFVSRNRIATMRSSWSSPHRSIGSTAQVTDSFPVPSAHLGVLSHPSRDPVHLDPAQGYSSYGAVDVARSERYAELSSQRGSFTDSSYETGSFVSSVSDEYSDPGSVHQPWLGRRLNEPI